jgi:pimeloyl-ACP methyl ester carboxylesterase
VTSRAPLSRLPRGLDERSYADASPGSHGRDGGVDLYQRLKANPPYPGFTKCFANGIDDDTAAVLAATQLPAAAAEFSDPSGSPAWKTIPSWTLIGTQDNVIPPILQEQMYKRADAHISRVKAGHLSLISNLGAVVRDVLSRV